MTRGFVILAFVPNATQYHINSQVDPLISDSLASGAVTNATYVAPTTITEYYYFITLFGGTSTATAKYQRPAHPDRVAETLNGLLASAAR